jgi:hypothetical protein
MLKKFLRILSFEFKPEPGPREVGKQHSLNGPDRSVKQHLFDADMIVKIFDVAQREHGAAGM